MKTDSRTVLLLFLSVIFLSAIWTQIVKAQETVTEPPLPIYVIYQDSLKAAFENSSSNSGLSLSYAIKKYDTLQMQIQRSSAESTAHFTWLYALIALLGTMNIVLLFSTSRIRKELAQIKRFEHQQKLVPVESPLVSPLPRERKEIYSSPKSIKVRPPARTHKTIVKKTRKS